MIPEDQKDKIRAAFRSGDLKVRSVSPEGALEWKRVLDVNRAEVPWEEILEGQSPSGPFVLTAGHRVFRTPNSKSETSDLRTGDSVLSLIGETAGYVLVQSPQKIPSRQYMYDLTAEDWHNFVLHRSKVVVSNSPDKNYHFRPPQHEGAIDQFNRIFGRVWEDNELLEYLERGLDWWNMFPPSTRGMDTLDKLCAEYPAWRTAVMWAAITHACFAVATNWVADEFDYSIGGVSLTLERSSKYESLKQNAEGQFDKATEAKARTVKFIRGLQQPKYGVGIRSSFGPHVGRGVLSPRNFLVWPLAFGFIELFANAASWVA